MTTESRTKKMAHKVSSYVTLIYFVFFVIILKTTEERTLKPVWQSLQDTISSSASSTVDYVNASLSSSLSGAGAGAGAPVVDVAVDVDVAVEVKAGEEVASSVFEPHEVCAYLERLSSSSSSSSQQQQQQQRHATASRIWQDHISQIMTASMNNLIPELISETNTNKLRTLLEETLPPSRLRRAVRHLPTFSHSIVQRIMTIIEDRIRDPDRYPPLRIVVFGGSVTLGRDCRIKDRFQDIACAWPQRLELLINQLFGTDIIKVYNLAVGGTNSDSGTLRVKYWMYPDGVSAEDGELKKYGPDIIINSYSTNDALPPWGMDMKDPALVHTVTDNVRSRLESFVREALQSKSSSSASCNNNNNEESVVPVPPPLIVVVDDYLGPQQELLVGEWSYVSSMTQISKYYDTAGISYGDVVRDIVYRNQADTTFANLGPGLHATDKQDKGNVHFGHFGHQTVAWSVGYATLELVTNYCDDEHRQRTTKTSPSSTANNNNNNNNKHHHQDDVFYHLPPPLTHALLLKNATAEFTAAREAAQRSYEASVLKCDNITTTTNGVVVGGEHERESSNPCAIAWLAKPGEFGGQQIRRFMTTYANGPIDGWKTERSNDEGWSNKDGWIATKAQASFRLEFVNISKAVQTVTIFFLRSYGDKWNNSSAAFTISSSSKNKNATIVGEKTIAGIHDDPEYKYSLTLSETMELTESVPKGDTLQLSVTLIGGEHFKIMGMMLCNK